MSEFRKPDAQPETTRNATLVGWAFTANSLILTVLSFYLINQGGHWGAVLVLAVASMALIAGILGTFLARRGKIEQGGWILFSFNILAALAIPALLVRSGYVIFLYVILSTYIIARWTLPEKARPLTIIASTIAALFSIAIEFLNPAWRIQSQLIINLSPVFFVVLTAFIAAILLRAAYNTNLRLKLSIPFGILALFSLSILAIALLSQTRRAIEIQTGANFVTHAEDNAARVMNFFYEKIGQLQVLSLSDGLRDMIIDRNASYKGSDEENLSDIRVLDISWVSAADDHPLIKRTVTDELSVNPANHYLYDFLALFPEQTEVFITDRYGATVSATSRLSDYYQGDEEWWQEAWNSGQGAIYISEPEYDESAGVTALLIALPIYNHENEVVGILRSTLNINTIAEIISKDQDGLTGHSVLFDSQGNVIFDPKEDTVNSANLPPDIIQVILANTPNYQIATDQNGIDFIFGHANIGQIAQSVTTTSSSQRLINEAVAKLGWAVIFRQEASEAFQTIRQQTNSTFTISFGLLLVFLAATIGISQLLLRPITNLTNVAGQVASGNLTIRANVESRDEIGQLAQAFNKMTVQLEELISGLEARVSERTAELEQVNLQVSRRAAQFEAIAQVSRTISTVRDVDELLRRITLMISQYFGFYHVGIFLIDENNEFAELRAANSEGGQRMLARKHKLRLGQVGIVGYVTQTGNPRIALDVGADAAYFDNPDLPETHSEMALPLKFGDQIIGALDVQSVQVNAFTSEDTYILSALADQVSTAIQNARLFDESRKALSEAETAYRQLTSQTWIDIKRQVPVTGYRFDGTKPEPLTNNQPDKKTKTSLGLEIPVKLRGVTVGNLRIQPPAGKTTWSQDEIAISQAIAERVALAAENARLIIESQKRAAKEQTIGEISAEIGASVNLDNILRTAVREMGRLLPGAEVSIQVRKEE